MSFCNFSCFRFGFEGGHCVLVAPVPGHCLFVAFIVVSTSVLNKIIKTNR